MMHIIVFLVFPAFLFSSDLLLLLVKICKPFCCSTGWLLVDGGDYSTDDHRGGSCKDFHVLMLISAFVDLHFMLMIIWWDLRFSLDLTKQPYRHSSYFFRKKKLKEIHVGKKDTTPPTHWHHTFLIACCSIFIQVFILFFSTKKSVCTFRAYLCFMFCGSLRACLPYFLVLLSCIFIWPANSSTDTTIKWIRVWKCILYW